MSWFPCPYLSAEVELTEERERHIAERHPDLLPEHRDHLRETLATQTRFGEVFVSGTLGSSPAGTLI
jgi:hypothetical protein